MKKFKRIGIDLAKNVFQVCAVDHAEKRVINKKLRRAEVLKKDYRTYFEPKNKLSEIECQMINHYLNCEEYKYLSPLQIVPRLLDEKEIYIASESTFYRYMRLTGQDPSRAYKETKALSQA
ncbi:hypothetical protein [Thorsellia anophelis]|uniref:Transposase n=1 Tax=Thorsellia anophelis DSM 18579 TaxID=1123402 RepID=A0A1I0FNQ1_9GAMM|nr:hypothetical protein SAMN02583745_02807 [Thorsellia anophelis DSM 18579]